MRRGTAVTGARVRRDSAGWTALAVLVTLSLLAGCGGRDPDTAAQRPDDVLGPVDAHAPAEDADDPGAEDGSTGDDDGQASDAAAGDDGDASGTGDGAADGGAADGGADPRPAATTLEFTASGSVLAATSGPPQDHVLDSCPIQPHAEQNITDCAFARGAAGEVLLTVEEFAGDHAVVLWQRPGVPGTGPWEPVRAATYGASEPAGPIVDTSVSSSAWPNLPDVVILTVDRGGSGGEQSFEVMGWPAGASGAQVLAVSDPRPAADLRAVAGRLLLTADHLAADDAACCPSQREIVVFEQPTGSPVIAERTVVERDARLPVEIALEVYAAWRDQDLSGIGDLLAPPGQQSLQSIPPGPGEDTFELQGRACVPGQGGSVCTFEDAGGGSTSLVLTVRQVDGAWLVTDAVLA